MRLHTTCLSLSVVYEHILFICLLQRKYFARLFEKNFVNVSVTFFCVGSNFACMHFKIFIDMHIAQWSAKAKSVFIGTYLFISLCCVLIYFVVYTAGS